jgi:predicted cupin superfamily sugar epimerase
MTVIHFLLTRGDFSAFHRLRSEEAWLYQGGAPLELVLLDQRLTRIVLGPAEGGGTPFGLVPPMVLQAARTTGDATLAACLVAPPFEMSDFSLPSRDSLLGEYPEHAETILSFTR